MPYFNFEYTKAITYTVENVGGDIGQDPATEVANLCLFVCLFFPVMAHITGAPEPVPQVPRPQDQCWKQNL